MKTLHISLLIAGLAIVAYGGTVRAEPSDAGMLNVLEVRQLMAREDSAAHTRLAAHFFSLAHRYAREAARDLAYSRSVTGNPNRTGMSASAAHWSRLAAANERWAATLSELGMYHDLLAAGVVSMPPTDSAPFESGYGALEPTPHELALAEARARTSTDYGILSEYFLEIIDRETVKAERHEVMASAYRGNANQRAADPAMHCDRLAKESREAAKNAREKVKTYVGFSTMA